MIESKTYDIWPEFNDIVKNISKDWGFNRAQSNGYREFIRDLSDMLAFRLITPSSGFSFKSALIAPFIGEILTPILDFKKYSIETFLKQNSVRFGMIALIVKQDGTVEKWSQSLLSPHIFQSNDILADHIEQVIGLEKNGVQGCFYETALNRHENSKEWGLIDHNVWMKNGQIARSEWVYPDQSCLGNNGKENYSRFSGFYNAKIKNDNIRHFNYGPDDVNGCLSVHDLVFTPYLFLIQSGQSVLKRFLSQYKIKQTFNNLYAQCYPDDNEIIPDIFNGNINHLFKIFSVLNDLACKESYNILKAAIQDFTQVLDQELFDLALTCGAKQSGTVYNWLIKGKIWEGVNLRAQALTSYPSLAHMQTGIIFHLSTDYPVSQFEMDCLAEKSKNIEKVINERLPLEPALVKLLDAPESVVRSLRGLSLSDGQRYKFAATICSLKEITRNDTALAKKFWPNAYEDKNKVLEEWNIVSDNIRSIEYLLDECLFSRSAFKMHQDTFRLHRIGNADYIEDMVASFKNQLLGPLVYDFCKENGWDNETTKNILQAMDWMRSTSQPLIENSLILNRTPSKIIDINRIWHQKESAINAVMGYNEACWPALFNPIEIDGYLFEPLCSSAELAREGNTLNHCVASYTNQCFSGNSHIIGVKKNSESVSTVELIVIENHGKQNFINVAEYFNLNILQQKQQPILKIAQHLGKKNSQVRSSESKALEILLSRIREGKINVPWELIQTSQRERKLNSGLKEIEIIIGYDPEDLEKRDKVLNAWSFAISKELRGISHHEWAKALDLKSRVEQFSRDFTIETHGTDLEQ